MHDYQRDGFAVLERFVEPAACDELIAAAARIVRDTTPETISIFTTNEQTRHSDDYFLSSGDKVRCFFEEDARTVNKIGHALHDLDPAFARFSHDRRFGELVASLGLARPRLLQSMYIFKHARVGGEVTPHQDHTFLWTDPPSVTGLWFALEDATVDNGCMWALPGSHAEPARRRFHRAAGGGTAFETLDERPFPVDGFVPLEAPKGTCIVLHGLLLHRSGANSSPRSRQAYSLHYIDDTAAYRADNWLQPGQ